MQKLPCVSAEPLNSALDICRHVYASPVQHDPIDATLGPHTAACFSRWKAKPAAWASDQVIGITT